MSAGRDKGLWAAAGSVVAAIVASACCWLPLVLASFGASAAGLSAGFERLRPLFLTLTALLLGAGFYLTYFRRVGSGAGTAKTGPGCAGDTCCAPRRGLVRINRVMLWLATGAVAAIALFPGHVGALVGSRGPSGDGPTLALEVQGMTCEACTVHVVRALEALPGVVSAAVDYDSGRALVETDPTVPPSPADLTAALAGVGYEARLIADPPIEDH